MEEEFMDEMAEDTQKGKYMTFQSGNEYFGLELQCVEEIIGIQPITQIPEAEEYVKGLINLRGRIVPVIDVRIRFKQEPFAYTDRTCIIIISVKGTVVGLIVETIADVVKISEENISPPPSLNHGHLKNKYVYGLGKVGDSVKLLLDPEKLIRDEELELLDSTDLEESVQDAEGGRENDEEN